MQEIKIVTRKMVDKGKRWKEGKDPDTTTRVSIKELTPDHISSEYLSASQSPAIIFIDDNFSCRFLYNDKGVAPEHLDYMLNKTFSIEIIGQVIIHIIHKAGL